MDGFESSHHDDHKSLQTAFSSQSIVFWLVFSFTIGVIFSPFAYGFVFLIGFAIVFALAGIVYGGDMYHDKNRAVLFIFAIFSISILGFLIGRAAVTDDRSPFRSDYSLEDDNNKKQWEEDEEKNEYDHEHELCD